MAAGLEINQLELPNYLASDTCPKPPPSSGCQSGRLGVIVVVTCYRIFLSLQSRKYMVSLCVILMIIKCLEKQESTRKI